MNELNIDDFSDKFSPYGDEKAYTQLLEEYSKRFDNAVSLPYSLENYGKVYTAIEMSTPLQIERKAAGMEHYFINSRTGKELKVQDHQIFAEQVRKNPKLFAKLDLDVPFLTKKQIEYYGGRIVEEDYEWFMRISPLVRVTLWAGLVFEYSSTSNNKNDVAEAVYNFCKKHKMPDFVDLFVSTMTDRGIRKTWGNFRMDYDRGDTKISSIKGPSNMNINTEIKGLCVKLAAVNILYDKDNPTKELQKLKDGIKAGFVNGYVSNLGGHSSLMLKVVKEPKAEWTNGIAENMTIFNFSIDHNGAVENFRSSYKPAMRKFMAKSIDEIIKKINDYINKQRG